MSDFEFILKKVEAASKIMEQLIDLATSDKIVNSEEKALLHAINDGLHQYLKTILEHLGETPIDKDQITKMESNLISNCEKVAQSDGVISEDERILLDELKKLVSDLSQLL